MLWLCYVRIEFEPKLESSKNFHVYTSSSWIVVVNRYIQKVHKNVIDVSRHIRHHIMIEPKNFFGMYGINVGRVAPPVFVFRCKSAFSDLSSIYM